MSAPQALKSERARNSQAQSSTSQSRANGHIGSASASQCPSAELVLCPAREQRLLHVPPHLRQQQQPVFQESELVEAHTDTDADTEHCRDTTTSSPSGNSSGSDPGGAALVVRHAVQQRVQQTATAGPGVPRGARSGPHTRHTGRQELLVNSAAPLCGPPYRCLPAERQSNSHCEASTAGLVAPPPLPPRSAPAPPEPPAKAEHLKALLRARLAAHAPHIASAPLLPPVRDVFSFFELRPALCTDLDRVAVASGSCINLGVGGPSFSAHPHPHAHEKPAQDLDVDDASSESEENYAHNNRQQLLSPPLLELQQSFSAPDLKRFAAHEHEETSVHLSRQLCSVPPSASCDQLSSDNPEATMAATFKLFEFDEAQSQQQPQQQQGPLERAHSTRSLAAPLSGAAFGDMRYKQAVHTDQLRTLVERERRAEEAAAATSPTRTADGGGRGRAASSSSSEDAEEQRVGEGEFEWRVRRSLHKLDVPKAVRKAAAARGENCRPVAAPLSNAALENGAPKSATASFVFSSSGANTTHRASTRSLVFRSYTNFSTIAGFGIGAGDTETGDGSERRRRYKVTLPSAKLGESSVRLAPIESKLPSSFEEFRRSMPNLAVLEAGQKRVKQQQLEAKLATPEERSKTMFVHLTPDNFKRTSARFATSGASSPTIGTPSPGFNESPVRAVGAQHPLREVETEEVRAQVQAALDAAPALPPLIPAPPNESLLSLETVSTSDRSSNRLELPATAMFGRSAADWHHVVKLLRRKTLLHKRLRDQSERRAVRAFQLLSHLTGVPTLDAQLSYLDAIDSSRPVRMSSDDRLLFLCETLLNELVSKPAVCEVLGRYAQLSAAIYGQGAVLLTLPEAEAAHEFYAKLLHYPTGFSPIPSLVPYSYTNGTSNGVPVPSAPSPTSGAKLEKWPLLCYVPVKDVRQSLVLGCGATVRTLADLTCLYNVETHLVLAVLLFTPDAPPAENVLQLSVKWLCAPILSTKTANGLSPSHSQQTYARVVPSAPTEPFDRLSRSLPMPKEKQHTPPRPTAAMAMTMTLPKSNVVISSTTASDPSASTTPKSATLPTREHKEHKDPAKENRETLVQQLHHLVRSHQLSLKSHFGELYKLAKEFRESGIPFERRVVRFVSPVDSADYELTFSADAQPTLIVVPPQATTSTTTTAATVPKRITSSALGPAASEGATSGSGARVEKRQSREVRVDREFQVVVGPIAASGAPEPPPPKPDRSTIPVQQHVVQQTRIVHRVLVERSAMPEAAVGDESKRSGTLEGRYTSTASSAENTLSSRTSPMRPGQANTLPTAFARVPEIEQGAPPPLPSRGGSRHGGASGGGASGRPAAPAPPPVPVPAPTPTRAPASGSPTKSRAPLPPPPPTDSSIARYTQETVTRAYGPTAANAAAAGGGSSAAGGGGSGGASEQSNQNGAAGSMNSYRRLGALAAGYSNGAETLSSSIRTTQL